MYGWDQERGQTHTIAQSIRCIVFVTNKSRGVSGGLACKSTVLVTLVPVTQIRTLAVKSTVSLLLVGGYFATVNIIVYDTTLIQFSGRLKSALKSTAYAYDFLS